MVSVSLGATIPVGEFQNLKPAVEIRNIRVDQEIEPQIQAAIEAAKVAWLAIDQEMEVQIVEMVSVAAGDRTVRDVLDELRSWVESVAKKNFRNIRDEVKLHKERIDALEAEKTGPST